MYVIEIYLHWDMKYMQMIYIDTWFSVFRLDLLGKKNRMIMPGKVHTVLKFHVLESKISKMNE